MTALVGLFLSTGYKISTERLIPDWDRGEGRKKGEPKWLCLSRGATTGVLWTGHRGGHTKAH